MFLMIKPRLFSGSWAHGHAFSFTVGILGSLHLCLKCTKRDRKNRSVLPAFVSLSPLSLDCVFFSPSAYFAFLVQLESFQGSGPKRLNLPASPPRTLSAYLTRFLQQLSVLPVGYFVDFGGDW